MKMFIIKIPKFGAAKMKHQQVYTPSVIIEKRLVSAWSELINIISAS